MKSDKSFYRLIVIGLLATPLHAQTPPSDTRINLAGTFNNWATGTSEYQMKAGKDGYELRRFFPFGGYKFKFVFDGSWDRHLGDAGNGKLVQPGADVQLDIPQSAEYVIRLNVDQKNWSLERCKDSPHPHAAFRVHQDQSAYFLDSSPSLAAHGRPLKEIKWKVIDPDGKNLPISNRLGGARFELTQRGAYQISLSVSDGKESDTTTRSILLGQNSAAKDAVKFSFTPTDLPKDLYVESLDLIGDFNNWKAGVNPMFSEPAKNKYLCRVALPDGVHHYKFLINGCIFRNDREADAKLNQSDGLNGHNSGIRVGSDAASFGEPPENQIICDAVRHDPGSKTYLRPITKNVARLTVRTLANDVSTASAIILGKRRSIPMLQYEAANGFDYWEANCTETDSNIAYSFALTDNKKGVVVNKNGCYETDCGVAFMGLTEAGFIGSFKMEFETPDWAKRAVWYQIFPERFRNGDPSNDPPRTVPWTHSWFKPYRGAKWREATGENTRDLKSEISDSNTKHSEFESFIYDRRYGGDLPGVREKLPYLRDLGISAIYFNPIFLAESLHKYDASDYRHIDDFFGVKDSLKEISGETTDPKSWKWSKSDRVFLDFLKEAHRLGFKVIIDGVFNHTGRNFWAFQDVLKNGEKSEYVDWFDIKSFKPFHYRAWDKDDGSLPRLKHDDALGLSKPVREHLFAVTRRWMDPDGDGNPADGIDGWRLDVAGDININFWKDWRKLVKSVNPDAYIVAELWQESREWLDGRSFDAVMNYPFAVRCQRFFVNDKKAIKPSEFDKQMKEIQAWYEPQVNYVLQNLFCSHDTDRTASMFMNPDLEYDQANRLQDNGPNYVTAKPTRLCYDKMKLMVTFQMTYLGAPMVYYGDEVGMYGADDPSDRKPMLWDDLPPNDDPDERIVPDVLEHHQRMIAIRNTYPALQLGAMHTIQMDDAKGIYVFARSLDNECIVVAMNNSSRVHRIDFKSPWLDGAKVFRLDDPKVAGIKMPAKDSSAARPMIEIIDSGTALEISKGQLKNLHLAPYTAAVLCPRDVKQ